MIVLLLAGNGTLKLRVENLLGNYGTVMFLRKNIGHIYRSFRRMRANHVNPPTFYAILSYLGGQQILERGNIFSLRAVKKNQSLISPKKTLILVP